MPREGTRRKRPWLVPTLVAVLALALVAAGIWAYQVWLELTSLPTAG